MTASNAISFVRGIRPNAVDEQTQLKFLSDIENMVRISIMGEGTTNPVSFTHDNVLDEMLVPPPFDTLYGWYLCAMVDLCEGNAELYLNDHAVFNSIYGDYAKWYVRTKGGTRLGKL